MSTFLAIINALPILWKFWGEFKDIIAKVKEMQDEARARKFLRDMAKATEEADESGDTSGYEDIIRNGK
jgi:hypothetical protein